MSVNSQTFINSISSSGNRFVLLSKKGAGVFSLPPVYSRNEPKFLRYSTTPSSIDDFSSEYSFTLTSENLKNSIKKALRLTLTESQSEIKFHFDENKESLEINSKKYSFLHIAAILLNKRLEYEYASSLITSLERNPENLAKKFNKQNNIKFHLKRLFDLFKKILCNKHSQYSEESNPIFHFFSRKYKLLLYSINSFCYILNYMLSSILINYRANAVNSL